MKKLIAAGFFLCIVSTASFAQKTQWQKNHPRRTEVNQRLENQNRRINNEVKEGEINHAQAQNLRQNDRNIRTEEKQMASQNHGHLTKAEQRALNQQENQNSRKIGN